ncbi:peptide deformylase [Chytridium lagenaria]|nr:peptide deformylase [Chytridium lagenaria]
MERVLYMLRLKRAKEVVPLGHPILRLKANPIKESDFKTSKITNAINDMRSVFRSPYHPVVGLAAPQVGHPLRIIAYQIPNPKSVNDGSIKEAIPLTFILNPTIESCESLPNYNAVVKRATRIQVKGLDEMGKEVEVMASGFLARLIQHEVDHLEGVTMVDRMEKQSLRHDKYVGKFDFPT